MEGILNLSTILTIVGILVVLTNIVVQVLKKATWGKLPTNILAIIVSMALTLVTFFAAYTGAVAPSARNFSPTLPEGSPTSRK